MLHVYRWDPSGRVTTNDLPASAADLAAEAVVWIDLEAATADEERRIFEEFLRIHPLTLEDVTRPRRVPDGQAHLPKVEEFPDYLFAIANPLPVEVCAPIEGKVPPCPRKWQRPQLAAILTENVLITHHDKPLPCVSAVRDQVSRRGDLSGRGPDFLFHLVLDVMVDEYAPVMDGFAERLSRVETRVFQKPGRESLTRLLRLKRQVLALRKTLLMEREVLARLVRREFKLVSETEVAYYRNVYDHLVRYTELIEGAREMVSDLLQTHLAAQSNRLNEVMKVLTMISVTILPLTLIAGIYGMNFEAIPGLKEDWGFPVSLGLMAFAAVAAIGYFRYKRWL
jgi:magnesium transporter